MSNLNKKNSISIKNARLFFYCSCTALMIEVQELFMKLEIMDTQKFKTNIRIDGNQESIIISSSSGYLSTVIIDTKLFVRKTMQITEC